MSKNYLNLEGLAQFLDKLSEKFSAKSGLVYKDLYAESWQGDVAPYTYNIVIDGHDNDTDYVELMAGDNMITEQILALQSANIVKAGWSDVSTLVLYAYGSKPTVDTPIKIIIRKDI